jgi:hypothetical protein
LYFSGVHYIFTNQSTYFVSSYRANQPTKQGPKVAVVPVAATNITAAITMAPRRPLLDPLVQSMPSAPTQAFYQRMSLTQPPATSSCTIPSLTSGQPNSAAHPFASGNFRLDGSRSMNHYHQPYFLINSARMSVRNPYAKVNTGHDIQTFTPQPTVTPTITQHQAAMYPQSRRTPLLDLASVAMSELYPNASHHFPTIPNRHLQARTLNTTSSNKNTPFALVPSQHDPREYEPNILYGPPSSSSSSDSKDTGPMIDLQGILVEPDKPTTPSVTTFITAADAIKHTSSSILVRNERLVSVVVDATSGATSPTRLPPLQDPPPPVKPAPTLSVDPPPAGVSFSTSDLARL